MGMLATIINSLALQDALEKNDVQTRVQSAIQMTQVAEPYIPRRAVRHLEKGRIVIFAAGMGDAVLLDRHDGRPASPRDRRRRDPQGQRRSTASTTTTRSRTRTRVRYDELTYLEVLHDGLGVMDTTAISLCMDNKLPIIVFNLQVQGNIRRALEGEPIGTARHADS